MASGGATRDGPRCRRRVVLRAPPPVHRSPWNWLPRRTMSNPPWRSLPSRRVARASWWTRGRSGSPSTMRTGRPPSCLPHPRIPRARSCPVPISERARRRRRSPRRGRRTRPAVAATLDLPDAEVLQGVTAKPTLVGDDAHADAPEHRASVWHRPVHARKRSWWRWSMVVLACAAVVVAAVAVAAVRVTGRSRRWSSTASGGASGGDRPGAGVAVAGRRRSGRGRAGAGHWCCSRGPRRRCPSPA